MGLMMLAAAPGTDIESRPRGREAEARGRGARRR